MSKIALSPNASGTGTFTVAAPNTNTDYTLTLPQGTGTVVANNVNSAIVSGTAVTSTSGTSIDFTGIPSWVKRVTVMFDGVSTNGTSNWLIQIGDSGGIETSGYLGASSYIFSINNPASTNYTAGFGILVGSATNIIQGIINICKLTGNTWTCSGGVALSNATLNVITAGSKTLSDTLDRIRITTVNGTDTFDAGSINILYE